MKSIEDTLGVIRNAVEEFKEASGTDTYLALIGGYSIIFYGIERTTLDVDVCFHADGNKPGEALHNFLQNHLPDRFRLRFLQASKDPSDSLKHDIIIIDDSEGEYPRIDILIARYKWELEGLKQAGIIEKLSFPIMPLPHLTAMKLLAAGRKDELDVLEILKDMSAEDKETAGRLAKQIGRERKFLQLLKEAETD